MEYYVLSAIAGLLFAIRIGFSKRYQAENGTTLGSSLIFTTVFSLFGTVLAFAMNGFKMEFSWYSLIFTAIIAAVEIIGVILSMKILANGSSLMYTLFLLSGGMVGPFIYGLAFLGEKPSIFCYIGTVLIIFALAIPLIFNRLKKKSHFILYFLCFLAFIFNAICGVTMKIHQTSDRPVIGAQMFTFYYFAIMAAVCPIIFVIWRLKNKPTKEDKPLVNKWLFICSAGYALIGTVASFLNVYTAKFMPATIQSTVVTSLSIIGSFFAGWLVYKERVSKTTLSQLFVAITGAILLIF